MTGKQKPTLAWLDGFTPEEHRLFDKWMERCHEIVEEEGSKLDIEGDGMPILAGVMFSEKPGWSTNRRVEIGLKLFRAFQSIIELSRVEPTGGPN